MIMHKRTNRIFVRFKLSVNIFIQTIAMDTIVVKKEEEAPKISILTSFFLYRPLFILSHMIMVYIHSHNQAIPTGSM